MLTRHGVRGLRAALVLGASGLVSAAALTATGVTAVAAAPAGPAAQEVAGCAAHIHGVSHVVRLGAVAHTATKRDCAAPPGGDQANGTPPLLFHGGPMMGTRSTGAVVLTPIYWNPAGHPIDTAYKNIINTYLSDVAAESGTRTNVYSTLTEYSGTNGTIRYQIASGTPVNDTNALPADRCQLNGHDKSRIYADNTGYDSCLDDNQIIAEME